MFGRMFDLEECQVCEDGYLISEEYLKDIHVRMQYGTISLTFDLRYRSSLSVPVFVLEP